MGKSYQTKRLCHQRPRSQELANDEPPQDGLDLGDTAVLGMDGIFLDKQCRTVCKENLSTYLARVCSHHTYIHAWVFRHGNGMRITPKAKKKKYSMNHLPAAEWMPRASLQNRHPAHLEP